MAERVHIQPEDWCEAASELIGRDVGQQLAKLAARNAAERELRAAIAAQQEIVAKLAGATGPVWEILQHEFSRLQKRIDTLSAARLDEAEKGGPDEG